jgi:myxalamid-type nonribosomal peptide synthetase MxaA
VTGKVTPVARAFESLSLEKRKLFELLLEKRAQEAQHIKPYPRTEGDGRALLPMSWAQQRLWFVDKLEEGKAAYNIPLAMRLHGPLDNDALSSALNALIQRHETLRTIFVSTEDGPRQEIEGHGTFSLQVTDLRAYAGAEREEQIRIQMVEEGRQTFDLRAGPLLRGRLLRLLDEEHLLLVTMHHIVSDGWSIGIFVRELCELYSAYHEGRAHSLSLLPIQYADYAQWQREWLQGERLDNQLDYWRKRLADAAPELHLPADRPRPAVKTFRGESLSVIIDEQLTVQLRALARANGMTLFMVLYAAAVCGLGNLAVAAYWPRRRSDRHSGGESPATGAGEPDRILREHLGVARERAR